MSKPKRARSGAHKKAAKQATHNHVKVTRATKFKHAALREDLDAQVNSMYALNQTVTVPLPSIAHPERISELADALSSLQGL
ncbi:hypothetical protein HGRIS_002741 [Hohenbuehelia grisea]|uniref:Uncharacterized protein n=1 Tax=Hohenbuehelia grisea TaxID=104357 RepID=A0ABR3JLX4_9AGAR